MGDVSPLAVVDSPGNLDATLPEIQEESSAPPEADSQTRQPLREDRTAALALFARSWSPGDAELSRCEHREGRTNGRVKPTRR